MSSASRAVRLQWYSVARRPQHAFASTVIGGQLFLGWVGGKEEDTGGAQTWGQSGPLEGAAGAEIWGGTAPALADGGRGV